MDPEAEPGVHRVVDVDDQPHCAVARVAGLVGQDACERLGGRPAAVVMAIEVGSPCPAGLAGQYLRLTTQTFREAARPMAIRIKARGGESSEQMLRRFKKMCEKEGLTKDLKKRAFYEKPSERRRRAARKSVKRPDAPAR